MLVMYEQGLPWQSSCKFPAKYNCTNAVVKHISSLVSLNNLVQFSRAILYVILNNKMYLLMVKKA